MITSIEMRCLLIWLPFLFLDACQSKQCGKGSSCKNSRSGVAECLCGKGYFLDAETNDCQSGDQVFEVWPIFLNASPWMF